MENQPKPSVHFERAHAVEIREAAHSAVETEIQVLSFANTNAPSVSEYVPQRIAEKTRGDYQAIKKKMGALAATDQDRKSKTQKDARFSVHELSRGPLSIEAEERRAIEERVKEELARVYEKEQSRGFQEGFEAGMQQGFDDVYEGYREEGRQQLTKFQQFVTEAENAKKDIFTANERFLIDMVYRVAGMIALKEIQQDRDYVLRICTDIIEKVGVRENIRIRINPEQVQIAGVLKTGLEEYFGKLNNLSIEPSSDVPTHGCIVDTEWNSIDATLERQLAGVRAALLGERQE